MSEPAPKPSATEMIDRLLRFAQLECNPEPMYVYKPRKGGGGAALKLDLRLVPTFNDQGYVESVDGGLYLEIAPQESDGDDGFSRFGWKSDKKVTAKLGMPDVLALLTGYERVRRVGKPIPAGVRAKDDENGVTVSLFHKFSNGSTSIAMKYEAEKSYLRIAKSRELHQSIALSLPEEIQVEAYLRLALTAFLRTGHR